MIFPKCKATIGDNYPDCPYCGEFFSPKINYYKPTETNEINCRQNNQNKYKKK